MKKIKNINSYSDYERALILGLIIGVFLLPVENDFVPQADIIYANLILICGMPLLMLASLHFAKVWFAGRAGVWQFIKYFVIGLSNTAINIGVFNYFINVSGVTRGIPLLVISSVAFLAAIINSYIWNSHWSFKEGFNNTIYQFERFFIVTFIGLLLNSTAVIMITTLFYGAFSPRAIDNIANLTGILCAMVWNFIGYKYFVFNIRKQ